MNVRKAVLLVLVGWLLISEASAKDGLDILQIFDAFALSAAAAELCQKPDQEALQNFSANWMLVNGYAAQELARRYPEYSKEQVARAMVRKREYLKAKVDEVVKAEGCASAKIQDLVKRYAAHASWQPVR